MHQATAILTAQDLGLEAAEEAVDGTSIHLPDSERFLTDRSNRFTPTLLEARCEDTAIHSCRLQLSAPLLGSYTSLWYPANASQRCLDTRP